MKNSTKKNSSYQLVINEVECYDANSFAMKIFSKTGVQHQILLQEGKDKFYSIGRINAPADDDRGELIIKNFRVPAQVYELFQKAQKYNNEKRSEFCDSKEALQEVKIYNKAFNEKIKAIAKEIYNLQNMGIDFDSFYKHLIY